MSQCELFCPLDAIAEYAGLFLTADGPGGTNTIESRTAAIAIEP